MTLDPTGANVAMTATTVVLLFAVMFLTAGSPLGRLVGIRTDARSCSTRPASGRSAS